MRLMTPVRVTAVAVGLGLAATACTTAASTSASTDTSTQRAATVTAASVDPAAAALPANVKGRGRLVFAMDASYAPFEYFATDNKTIIGFDVDLSNAIAQKLGLKARQVNAGFDTILPGLAAGKYDAGISAFSVSPDREKTVDFVVYLKDGSGLAVKAGNPLGLTMDPTSLCGHTVAAQKGTTQGLDQLPAISKQCTASGKPAVTIQLYPSQDEANLALTSGRADGVLADSVPLGYEAKLSQGQFQMAPGDDYDPAPIGVALPKGSPLKPSFDAALRALAADGTLAHIAQQWAVPAHALPSGS